MSTAATKRKLKQLRTEIRLLKAERAKLRFRARVKWRKIKGLRVQLNGWIRGRNNDAATYRLATDLSILNDAARVGDLDMARRAIEYWRERYEALRRHHERTRNNRNVTVPQGNGADGGTRSLVGGDGKDSEATPGPKPTTN